MIRTPHFSPLRSIVIGSFVVALLLTGCDLTGDSSPQSPDLEVTNDLDSRIIDLTDDSKARTANSADFSVSGVIRVTPPPVVKEGDSMTTTASHLSFNEDGGDRVFVGYKIPGGPFGGGIDVFNAAQPKNLTGINSIKSKNLDVQEIADDPDEGAEYVAGALETNRGDASPSVIVKLSFSGNSGNNITTSNKRLSGNVAKSVVNAPDGDSEHDFYVVTDENALYRYDADLGNELRQSVGGEEISSVAANADVILMLTKAGGIWQTGVGSQNDPDNPTTLDDAGIDPIGIARLNVGSHASSSQSFNFAALNEGGFRILNAGGTDVLFRQTEGTYTSVSATNESDYLYASRNNGTVEVYEFEGNNSWSPDPVDTINTAEFEGGGANTQSNQVLAVGDYLYVANSTDGLLVLEVDDGSPGGGP